MPLRRTPWLPMLAVSSVVAALFLLNCGDTSSTTRASVDVGVEPSSSAIGVDGGVVESGDVSISVPAGALADDVEIAVNASDTPAEPEGVEVVGPTVEIGPTGTTFAVPATVQIPYVVGALPTGRTEADVRIYTADAISGPWTALDTTVDVENDVASAEVDHLSHFVPGVVPVSSADPVCPEMGECDCDPVWASRTLDMLGTATVGRYIERFCYRDSDDTLSVLSYTLPADPGPGVDPDQYYLSEFDGTTLEQQSETPTDATTLDDGTCTMETPSFTSGTDGDVSWSVRYEEVRAAGGIGTIQWIHAMLRIGNGVTFSFNRHLNTSEPYTDTHSFYDHDNGAAARLLDDGSARFYLNIYHEAHIDVMYIDNLTEILADPNAFEDEDGFIEPSAIERIELAEGEQTSGTSFNPIHVSPAADDPNADIVVAFERVDDLIHILRVQGDSGLDVTELSPLPIHRAEFWGQYGWQNGGLDSRGILYAASAAGSFTNAKIIAIDPTTGELVGDWTIGCIGPSEIEGFTTVPWESGLTVRFGQDPFFDESVRRTMFIRDGLLEAIGDAPFHSSVGDIPRLLTDARGGRLYVGDWETGEIAGISLP